MKLARVPRLLVAAALSTVLAACAAADPSPPADASRQPSPSPVRSSPPATSASSAAASSAPSAAPGAGAPASAPPSAAPSARPSTVPGSPTGTESPEAAPADSELAPLLQQLLDDWLAEAQPPGAVLGVRLPDGRTAVVAAGLTDAEDGRAVDPGHRFRIGSITKTFVAALVLQLVDEGRLALDDSLEGHLPDAPHAREVTVRQLLDHTSGIFDFAAEPAYRSAMLTAPAREWRPEDVLRLVADRELDFAPGSDWSYSNTNYVLLGLIAEEVTGRPLSELLRARIHGPLGLESTFLEGLEPAPPMTVNGHFDIDGDGSPDSLRRIPYTALVTSGAAAGGLSAAALDVLDFASGLFGGELVGEETLGRMLERRRPAEDYGLGVAYFEPGGRPAWGHSGGLPGFSTLLVHLPDEGLTAVAMANATGADVAGLVERTVSRVIEAEAGEVGRRAGGLPGREG